MTLTMLKCKIHRAVVTGARLDYEGSVALCPDLIAAAGLRAFERVEIYDVNNGERLATYVIRGEPGEVCLNGAAARLVQPGDLVIIAAYCAVDEREADAHQPRVVLVGAGNRPRPVAPLPGGGAAGRS
jgi:aspartate 1-decarboxylase